MPKSALKSSIKKIENRKAPGLDSIHPEMLNVDIDFTTIKKKIVNSEYTTTSSGQLLDMRRDPSTMERRVHY